MQLSEKPPEPQEGHHSALSTAASERQVQIFQAKYFFSSLKVKLNFTLILIEVTASRMIKIYYFVKVVAAGGGYLGEEWSHCIKTSQSLGLIFSIFLKKYDLLMFA